MMRGESVFQDIKLQFNSLIPYGGHHREFTLDEMKWMMQEIGCNPSTIRSRQFDYNLFQFSEISGIHLEALMAMITDPSLSDTILIGVSVSSKNGV